MIPVVMLSGIIGLSACGNKTEQPQQNADTLEVADTIKEDTAAVDTPQTAEVQENAQEEKTVDGSGFAYWMWLKKNLPMVFRLKALIIRPQ